MSDAKPGDGHRRWAQALRRVAPKADYLDDHRILVMLADAYEFHASKADGESDGPTEVEWDGPTVPDPTDETEVDTETETDDEDDEPAAPTRRATKKKPRGRS